MKRCYSTGILMAICIILWGCPYSSPYGIDAVATEGIDDNLLGNWATLVNKPSYDQYPKADSVQICFTRYTDKEYTIAITGAIKELLPYHCIERDTIKGNAYLSTINKKKFLNVFVSGRMYIAELIQKPDGLTINCLAERFTAKYIKTCDQLRSVLSFHYRVAISPAYDDFFVLKNLHKIN